MFLVTRQRRTDFSGIVGYPHWSSRRQRRTDFSGIVGRLSVHYGRTVNVGRISQVLWAPTLPTSRHPVVAVNLGRISQVLWDRLNDKAEWFMPDEPSTKDGFLRYCGQEQIDKAERLLIGRQRRTDFSGIVGALWKLPSDKTY